MPLCLTHRQFLSTPLVPLNDKSEIEIEILENGSDGTSLSNASGPIISGIGKPRLLLKPWVGRLGRICDVILTRRL